MGLDMYLTLVDKETREEIEYSYYRKFNALQGYFERYNGLLRKDGLPKDMNFNTVDQTFVSSVAARRNHIPRKSLNYRTPLEVFLSYMDDQQLSSLF